ncbi:MAG TPA: hypothetical protein VMU38_03400 [Candidatus Binatia bacterium]|nr:hypothetical protein [Candidatus Binatia bacterium]
MSRPIFLAFVVLSQLCAAAASAHTCEGVDLAITTVKVKSVSTSGNVNHYTIEGTVANLGTTAQLGNILQFVDISQYGRKLDARGIQPLAPGQSADFTYVWPRSTDAGTGTSQLDFKLDMRPPIPSGQQECNTANDHYSLTL